MIGEIFALSAALCWAISAVLYKRTLRKSSYFTVNLVRTFFAALLLLVLFPITNYQVSTITINLLVLFTIAAVINLIIGDTFYFMGLKKIGVSRTQSISSSYPLFSMILAALFLQEGLTASVVIGTPLIVGGIALVSLNQNNTDTNLSKGKTTFFGVILPLVAAVFWGVGLIILKIALTDSEIDPIFAVFLSRVSVLPFLFLAVIISGETKQLKRLTKIDIVVLGVAGMLALSLGGSLLFSSLTLIDASIAIPLSSTSPFLSILLASLFLKEKVTLKIILGTVLIVTGLILLTFYA